MNKTLKLLKGRIALKDQTGWVLVSAIIMILFLTAIGLTIAQLSSFQYQHTQLEEFDQNASLVAEAGIEQSVNQLNDNNSFTGYNTAQTFFNNGTQGMGQFTSTVTNNPGSNSKTITSTGQVYQPSNASNPYVKRSVRVTVVGTQSSGYSVLSGPGGLILTGSANITNSDVYVGGTISMTGAAQIGTNSKPVNVDVANNACPSGSNPGPTYSVVCIGSQPISLSGSATIYGSVCATGQTSSTGSGSSSIKTGNGGQGLEAGCTAPAVTQPAYSRQNQISSVTTTAAGNSNSYVCNSFPFNRNWTANLELTGNVGVGSSCNVTINGNVYITGNLTINGAATMAVANGVTTEPVVLVDGTITVGGSASMLANAGGIGIEFISFDSNAACGATCVSFSGNALHSTQSFQTISIGGAARVPGMIFDAYWGLANEGGSGNVGALAGQTVELSGAGTVVFGTILSSGTETWTITSYQPLYSP